jgi:hypothetical protein
MASIFKRACDRKRPGSKWIVCFVDENGRRVTKTGYTDKAATESLARHLETEASQRRNGMIDPRQEGFRIEAARPLSDHFNDWQADLLARGSTAKHADIVSDRARRLVAVSRGSRIADLDGKT